MTWFRHDGWTIAAAGVVLVGLTFGIGGYPLLDPDEGRNAEVAREMAESNNYVVPQLNGLPYIDKPVLYFASVAAVMEILGPTEIAARLPSLFFTLGTLSLVGWFAWRTFGPTGGIIAAVATGSMPLTLAFSRTVIFDSALTFFVVLSILAFFQAAEVSRRDATRWTVLAWAALALGTLTKGPIAILLPLMVIAPYLGWRRRWYAMWDLVGLLLFVAMLLPWVLAMLRVVPDFLSYALVTETVRRFTTDDLARTGPFWYFIPIAVSGALPWSILAVGVWWNRRAFRDPEGRWDRRLVLFVLWILVPLVFFSLSQSKRPQYVLPLMPAFGLLAAMLLSKTSARVQSCKTAGLVLAAIGVTILFAKVIVGRLLEVDDLVTQAIPGTALGLGLVCVSAGVAAFVGARRHHIAVLALSVPVASIPLVSGHLMDAIGQDRSARSLATSIAVVLDDDTDVVGVQAYPLSLPFYLRRTLILSTSDASELTSNFLTRSYARWVDLRGSLLRPEDWWFDALVECRRPTVFVVRSDDERVRAVLAARVPVIGETRKAAAYGPCGVSDLAAHPRTSRELPGAGD